MTTEIFPIERARVFSCPFSSEDKYYVQYCRILNENIKQAAMNGEDHCYVFFPNGNIPQVEQLRRTQKDFEEAGYRIQLHSISNNTTFQVLVSWSE